MKNKIILPLLFLLTCFACKQKGSETTLISPELLPHLNGTWHLVGINDGSPNPTQPATPLISDEVIWEINGKELTITLAIDETFARLEEGKYEIDIETVPGLDDHQFLIVDGDGFGQIIVTEDRLTLNTGRKPNESISHAPIYAFAKKE